MRAILIALVATSVSACGAHVSKSEAEQALTMCAGFGGLRYVEADRVFDGVYATCNDGTYVRQRMGKNLPEKDGAAGQAPQSFAPQQGARVRKVT